METNDIRWKQRFENFGKSLSYLETSLQINNPDIVQKAGIIQFFEMSYELAWNTMKDYLQDQGFVDITSPRSAIKKAFEVGLIEDGHNWMQLLSDRNLTSHVYDEAKATEIETLIQERYYPLFRALHQSLKTHIND